MKGTAAAALARWRDWRAGQGGVFPHSPLKRARVPAGDGVPGVPGDAPPPGTGSNSQKTAIVPGVPTVPAENDDECTGTVAPGEWAAWALGFVAEAAAALAEREPDAIEAAEREAVAADGAGDLGAAQEPAAEDWAQVDAWVRGAAA